MNFDKESKSRIFLRGAGGGGRGRELVGTGGMNLTATIFRIHDTLSQPFSFMKIILTVFKIEKMALKQTRENNSESVQTRLVIPIVTSQA